MLEADKQPKPVGMKIEALAGWKVLYRPLKANHIEYRSHPTSAVANTYLLYTTNSLLSIVSNQSWLSSEPKSWTSAALSMSGYATRVLPI